MKLVCPSCGAIHSAESWQNDAHARQTLRLVADLPPELGGRVLDYVGAMFRPQSGRGLSWRRAGTLIAEVAELALAGHVQIDRKPARPAGPAMWAEGLSRMILRPPADLPLSNHNYLRKIVYGIADEADKIAERQRIAAEQSGALRARQCRANAEPVGMMDLETMRKIREENMRARR